MAGFKGKYEHSIDDKGRVSLPSRMRKSLSSEAQDAFVITRGHETCLYLYPMDTWNTVEEDIRKRLNVHKEQDRLFMRTLLMWAHEVGLDKQARFPIPQELLDFAQIKGSVLLIGALDKIEVWSPDVFTQYLERHSDQSFEAVAAAVLGGD